MDFGTLVFTKPERALTDVKFAEDRGFSHAWFPDSHMIWGDPFVCMALAATNTRTIKLGTGVAVASSRIAPVTVHSIATIDQLAPGRVILGFGTGHTGRRVMGLPPVKQAEFGEQVRLIHDLLRDGEGLYNTEGLSRKINSCIAIAGSSISMTRFHSTSQPTVPSRSSWQVCTGTACLPPESST